MSKFYLFIILVLLAGCKIDEADTQKLWGVSLPLSAKRVGLTQTPFYFKGRIIAVEYRLSKQDFNEFVSHEVGFMPMPKKVINYETGFLGYSFDTATMPVLLISRKEENGILMQAICDTEKFTVVLMRQDQ